MVGYRQNYDLLLDYQTSRSRRLRTQIFKINKNLIHSVINRMGTGHWRSHCEYEDLYQVGSIGLLHAIDRFSPDNGSTFSSFAFVYIRGRSCIISVINARSLRRPVRSSPSIVSASSFVPLISSPQAANLRQQRSRNTFRYRWANGLRFWSAQLPPSLWMLRSLAGRGLFWLILWSLRTR
jgi:RNA polymerase sigma factor (sigma-70 family)